jgi:hypothetical protein
MVSCLNAVASFLHPFDKEVTTAAPFGDTFACQQDRTEEEGKIQGPARQCDGFQKTSTQ